MASKLIVFDMDGVLVDPTGSYRQTVVETVALFGGRINFAGIEDYKNQGGWNNDWALTQRILADQGVAVSYEDVRTEFNGLFRGAAGLVMKEDWLAADGMLVEDFSIGESPGVLHVRNAPSPAATASLAIGRELAEMAISRFALP